MTTDQRLFRNALGCFATGVAVVTTQVGDEPPIGITINSFSSVSLDPPLVLWCLDKKSDTLPVFNRCTQFVVNVLREGHEDVSNRLSRQGEHQLTDLALKHGVSGMPVLAEALAIFECDVDARHDAGDHVILVGRVRNFEYAEEGQPLIYHRGGYQALTR